MNPFVLAIQNWWYQLKTQLKIRLDIKESNGPVVPPEHQDHVTDYLIEQGCAWPKGVGELCSPEPKDKN